MFTYLYRYYYHSDLFNTPCKNANSFPNWILCYSLFLLRIGFLYGKIIENAKVKVEVIYEPPQETTDISFQLLSDSGAVEDLAYFPVLKFIINECIYVGCCRIYRCNVRITKGWMDNCPSRSRKGVRCAAASQILFECINTYIHTYIMVPWNI